MFRMRSIYFTCEPIPTVFDKLSHLTNVINSAESHLYRFGVLNGDSRKPHISVIPWGSDV